MWFGHKDCWWDVGGVVVGRSVQNDSGLLSWKNVLIFHSTLDRKRKPNQNSFAKPWFGKFWDKDVVLWSQCLPSRRWTRASWTKYREHDFVFECSHRDVRQNRLKRLSITRQVHSKWKHACVCGDMCVCLGKVHQTDLVPVSIKLFVQFNKWMV